MSLYVETAKQILRTFHANNFEAYFVGGFVRDTLLGRSCEDIDITTSATPNQVIALFDDVKRTGRKFGGVTILMGGFSYEVTTYRLESEYHNHRHPSKVSFSSNLEDDLKRRDFTVNALVMDDNDHIIDLIDGQADLDKRILRTIGDANQRFHEDALRILRAFRFVSKLGFTLAEDTVTAIANNAALVETIAIERVMVELDKTCQEPHQQQAFLYMVETGVHNHLPGLTKGIEFLAKNDINIHPLELFIIGFIFEDIDDRWRFSNRDIRLIYQVMNLHEVTKDDAFNKFVLFSNKLEPCLLANRINVLLGYPDQEQAILRMWDEMPVKDVCDLAFKGQDILELTTLKKRSIIGLVIDDLLYEVIMNNMPNTYDTLKPFALQRVHQLQTEMGEDHE
ncbi:CCA tRNA nucleotidyltransferase [Candidatus Xianfuyuplasma coldseepsis]|uniref:CCA tRNA nucleotidyltransferase n=1 Tax=Candidatus Xianfuyuplasma coldseepsis TaxID=2782163 RepID=A0A7L7KP71_9MOLU|nr:CCA tRNA nucleotidyltransferase [Xianfuyuplasma coldseepsis]QMS84457.1 CCA tRNA nucleotidyltransferase [Xianfuyuplasma coldseepsis]